MRLIISWYPSVHRPRYHSYRVYLHGKTPVDQPKTICFSRSAELHEKIIGSFIERFHFN
ncbi:hypothetical protein GL272_14055 [Aeromonas veronii]|nr:hypothetical protein [Aeromonas veronii]